MAETATKSNASGATRLERRKARTRQALVDAAVRLIAEGRGERASIQEITEAADIGFGSFYNHFEGKEELFRTASEEILERWGQMLDRACAGLNDPAEIFSTSFRISGRLGWTHPELAGFIIMQRKTRGVSPRRNTASSHRKTQFQEANMPEMPQWVIGKAEKWHANGNGHDEIEIPELETYTVEPLEAPIPPRGWLLGTSLCRRYISALLGGGGVGKTAVRLAQALSLASGHSLTGDHVFERVKVLFVSLEDDVDEMRRRIRAAMIHHKLTRDDLDGWFYFATPAALGLKLATVVDSTVQLGRLGAALEAKITELGISALFLDPFIKAHSVAENVNTQIDEVMTVLMGLAQRCDCAVDLTHHVAKGPADPGNADRGRGASAFKDAARLVSTLTAMTPRRGRWLRHRRGRAALSRSPRQREGQHRATGGRREMVQAGGGEDRE